MRQTALPLALVLCALLAIAAPVRAQDRYSPAQRETLLNIAHQAVTAKLDGAPFHLPDNLDPALLDKAGAFVTLKHDGALRGCVGYLAADTPLAKVVAEMAQAAAFSDPRFPPLRQNELPGLSFEISVLGPMQPLASLEDVIVGKHGLLMRKGFKAGLLLPQVATEYGWDRQTFLEETCNKAGMDQDCYKDKNTKIEVFTAEVF